MKKNTTYGAVALSLVLLLSVAPAMAMENPAAADIPAPAVEPDVHLNYAGLIRAKLAAFTTATKDAAYNAGTKAVNGAKFVANPFASFPANERQMMDDNNNLGVSPIS